MPRDLHSTAIYHITNIANLPAILAEGRLVSDAILATRQGGPAVAIGHNHMKRRRLQETRIQGAENRFVGEFVPFYFCPRSPMLYSVNLGNTGLPPGSQGEILHLVSSVATGIGLGRQWAISDANAGTSYPDFYTDVAALDSALDWNAINAKYWSQCASQKAAEFLVADEFPWTAIQMIGCHTQAVAVRVNAALDYARHKPIVQVMSDWYYN